MYENHVYWIPVDPSFVPSEDAARRAAEWLRSRAPEADKVTADVTPEIQFVDCGANFEALRCPLCAADLSVDWWQGAMDKAAATEFTDRATTVPCCGANTRLEDLRYEWPQGFARFVLDARNPNIGTPTEEDDEHVARLLGTPVRRILAHY
jgi:hypothetical protein